MKKFLSTIFMIIAIILAIIIAVVLLFPAGATALSIGSISIGASGLTIFGTTLGVGVLSAIAIGSVVLAYIIDRKNASNIMNKATTWVGDAVSGVAGAIGKGVKSFSDASGLTSLIKWVLIGTGIYLVVDSYSDHDN